MGTKRPKKPPFKVWYVGLESYNSRYSYQLGEWNARGFKRRNVTYQVIDSPYGHKDSDKGIKTGQVLDAVRRPLHAMDQISTLLGEIAQGNIKPQDMIFFEDMFHPGFEALAYALDQMPREKRPYIVVRCLAQTIDPDDFVHGRPEFATWMRRFEQMALGIVDAVFAASEEMVTHMTIAGWKVPVYVTGLPFDETEVRERACSASVGQSLYPFHQRKMRVVFASRTDWEKQPEFFIRVARWFDEEFHNSPHPVEFAILSGKPLVSNSEDVLNAIIEAVDAGTIKVYDNLSKDEYYSILGDSRVLFNCALQDWVSNTVSEADALGTNVLFPAYRSFPEVFENDHVRLYIPWSLEDAVLKLKRLLVHRHPDAGDIAERQTGTVGRTIEAMGHLLISTYHQKGIELKDSAFEDFMWCETYRNPEDPSQYRRLITKDALSSWREYDTNYTHPYIANAVPERYWVRELSKDEFFYRLREDSLLYKHRPANPDPLKKNQKPWGY